MCRVSGKLTLEVRAEQQGESMEGHRRGTGRIIVSCLFALFLFMPRPAAAEPGSGLVDAGLEIGVHATYHFSPTLNGTDYPTSGAGVGIKALHAFGEVYSLGLQAENLWLYNPQEFDVTQQDFLVLNRFWLYSDTARALGLELGLGMARYSGMVDIPEDDYCFGCGRYGDTTYQPAVHAGVLVSQQVHRYVLIQTGARLAFAMSFLNQATDIHNFIPGLLTWNLDAGLAVPLF